MKFSDIPTELVSDTRFVLKRHSRAQFAACLATEKQRASIQ